MNVTLLTGGASGIGKAVALTAARAVSGEDLIRRGWWPTAVLGPLGGAAAGSLLRGGSLAGTTAAIALAAALLLGRALGVPGPDQHPLTDRRELGDTSTGPLFGGTALLAVLAIVAALWPAVIAWPIALLAAWFALNLGIHAWRLRRPRPARQREPGDD